MFCGLHGPGGVWEQEKLVGPPYLSLNATRPPLFRDDGAAATETAWNMFDRPSGETYESGLMDPYATKGLPQLSVMSTPKAFRKRTSATGLAGILHIKESNNIEMR